MTQTGIERATYGGICNQTQTSLGSIGPLKPLWTYKVQTDHGEFSIRADSDNIVGLSSSDAKLALYIQGEVVALFRSWLSWTKA